MAVANELSLPVASLHLGNFDAFRLMACGETPNDGTLHTAAFLALPKFVAWLLKTHDPNRKAEEFDNLIPLAIVCATKPHPVCKIANEESDWQTRQKTTIRLLARGTDIRWRSKGRTVLHIALEEGPDVTKALVEALNIRYDPQKDEKYLYTDKDGIHYSPHVYVKKILDGKDQEKKELIKCLLDCGMKSRYFKKVWPNAGIQPKGYHGLPSAYATSWEIHEESLHPSPVRTLDSYVPVSYTTDDSY